MLLLQFSNSLNSVLIFFSPLSSFLRNSHSHPSLCFKFHYKYYYRLIQGKFFLRSNLNSLSLSLSLSLLFLHFSLQFLSLFGSWEFEGKHKKKKIKKKRENWNSPFGYFQITLSSIKISSKFGLASVRVRFHQTKSKTPFKNFFKKKVVSDWISLYWFVLCFFFVYVVNLIL